MREASVRTERTRDGTPAAPDRLGDEQHRRDRRARLEERVRQGYHPRRGGRYDTLGLLGIDLSTIQAGAAPFHGIDPGKRVLPLGQLDLPVCFGTPSNFHRETLTFEVVGFRGTYHAVLG